MFRLIGASFRRWAAVFTEGIVAAAVVWVLRPFFTDWSESAGQYFGAWPEYVYLSILLVICCAGGSLLARHYTPRFHSIDCLRYCLLYPPSLVAACVGMLACYALDNAKIQQLSLVQHWAYAWSFAGMAAIFAGSIVAGIMHFPKPRPWRKPQVFHSGDFAGIAKDPHKLITWAQGEESPIEHEDLFDRLAVARRVARHLLFGKQLWTFGLIGPYGSGKTSILRIVEHYLANPQVIAKDVVSHDRRRPRKIWVAWVGSWGAGNESVALRVLEAVVHEMAQHIDCLAFSRLPAAYREAVQGSAGSVIGWLFSLLDEPGDPEAVIARLDPILQAANSNLVLFIEDLDRNHPDPVLFAQIQSLLDRLKQQVKRVGFILCVGSDSKDRIDFGKVCDKYEYVPDLPRDVIETAITTLGNHLINQYPEDVRWSDDEPNRSDRSEKQLVEVHDTVVPLMRTPRALRALLRHVSQAWPSLHGEVDLNEFIQICILRTASSDGFEFLASHIRELRGHVGYGAQSSKEAAKKLNEEWSIAAEQMPVWERNAVYHVIDRLFPSRLGGEALVFSEMNPQSIRHGPYSGFQLVTSDGVDYFQRMMAEDIDGIRDQDVIRLTLAWKESPATKDLILRMLDEPAFALRWEAWINTARPQDLMFVKTDDLYSLAGQCHRVLAERDGVRAECGDHTGFIVPWRTLLNQRKPRPDHLDWTVSEAQSVMNTSLRLACDIAHYWTHERHVAGENERSRAYASIVESMRTALASVGPEWLIHVLDPSYPWTLLRLVGSTDDPAQGTSTITWLSDALLDAAAMSPEIIIPVIAVLISKHEDRHESDPETGMPDIKRINLVDKNRLMWLFPDRGQRRAALALVATHRDYPYLTGQGREMILAIQHNAKQMIGHNIKVDGV